MIKKLSFALIFFGILNSCSKIGSIGPKSYYIKAKFNGENKAFTNLVTGQRGLDKENLVHLVLGASHNNNSSFPSYDLEIWDLKGNITTGTYAEGNYQIQSRYALDGFTRFNNLNTANDFKITISSISTTEAKGSFEGTLSKGSENIIITEGEFFVPLKD